MKSDSKKPVVSLKFQLIEKEPCSISFEKHLKYGGQKHKNAAVQNIERELTGIIDYIESV